MAYSLYFDASKKQKSITYGILIEKDGQPFYKSRGTIENTNLSNNFGEYFALIMGLFYCRLLEIKEISIYGDSQNVVHQITGQNRAKSPIMKESKRLCMELLTDVKYQIFWIPRKANKADRETR